MPKCYSCNAVVDKLSDYSGAKMCEKCKAILELTFNGRIGKDFFMILPAGDNIFFFTHNRIIVAIYHMQKGTKETGIAVQHHYTSWLAAIKINKVAKEMAYMSAEEVMLSFPLNYAIHYEDIIQVKVSVPGRIISLELVTDTKSYFLTIPKKLGPGLESLLGCYLGDRIDWTELSTIEPGSEFLPKWPEDKEIDIPGYVDEQLAGDFKEALKYAEANNPEKIISKTTDIIENKKPNQLTSVHLYFLKGSAHFTKTEYTEAKADYDKCIEIADELGDDPAAAQWKQLALKASEDVQKKSGCFIATAALGNENAPEIRILKAWRDTILLPSRTGRFFVNMYLFVSPTIASAIRPYPLLRKSILVFLIYPFTRILRSRKWGN